MGFSPAEVKAMSVFEYLAALEGFSEANNPDQPGKLSQDEIEDLWDWVKIG